MVSTVTWRGMKLLELKKLQETLRLKVVLTPFPELPSLVAGCDVSYSKNIGEMLACFALFTYPGLRKVSEAYARRRTDFPYIPGYLSFRELPVLLEAYEKLHPKPGLILVDGQGIAHPRGFGLASHLGVEFALPTVGCAKTLLYGHFLSPPPERGSFTPLADGDEILGAVLRTRDRTRPLFVSPGHLVDLSGAIRAVLLTSRRYRLPEPLRFAHILSKRALTLS